MLASSLNAIIGQRLLRKIVQPRKEKAPTYIEQDILNLKEKMSHAPYTKRTITYEGNIYQPDKRVERHGDGYKWRVAVYEILQINSEIKQLILDNASTIDIQRHANEHGFLTMKENAYLKMLDGTTSLEEIERVLS